MYADLFTVNREQVVELCNELHRENLKIKWTCNSRVDYVDEEMLQLMAKAGCWLISWGIESGNEEILKHAAQGRRPENAPSRRWPGRAQAGIKNWGYFIIGLPGETVETIQQTIDFSKKLPLDIALFHIAAPYPGTPFFFEVVEERLVPAGHALGGGGHGRVDTVLDYPNLRGRGPRVLAEARLPRVGAAGRARC